jgi:hypothetical protein
LEGYHSWEPILVRLKRYSFETGASLDLEHYIETATVWPASPEIVFSSYGLLEVSMKTFKSKTD